jgi:hypothetical protein
MRVLRSVLLALALGSLTAARAQEVERERQDAAPDLDFLEYLGAWAEDDDEWLAIEEWRKDNAADVEKDARHAKDAKEAENHREDDDESK